MAYYLSPRPSTRRLLIGAPFVASLLLSGCQKAPEPAKRGASPAPVAAQSPTAAVSTPEANIFVDEARLAKPFAIIGGTVQNVGGEKLEQLSVEIELRRRADGRVERREVAVEPGELAPGKQGKFRLKVLSEEWSGSRVVRLRSGARTEEVAFKPLPGAKRPPERFESKVVDSNPPARKSKRPANDEFINTPDTPYSVP
jgi:hypothetical protein